MQQTAVLPLKGVVQDYAWGGFTFIPELIRQKNEENKPFAELWMGIHHRGPAQVQINGQWVLLEQVIQQAGEKITGQKSFEQFGPQLPYLFKVLDVRQMLSIQAHPTKRQAEIGFQRENEADVPLDAKYRNYRDDNHKPEVMVALTDFWLLHGFLFPEDLSKRLSEIPELKSVLDFFEKSGRDLQALYRWIMEAPQSAIDELLLPLRDRLDREEKFEKNQPEFWAARAFKQFRPLEGECDRGVLSIFLMNIVGLKPGQGVYQAAGILHAYLEGVNVELMANSDNVFRGGLTVKHVDVAELMDKLLFDPVVPQILNGESRQAGLRVYPTPAPDFELSQIALDDQNPAIRIEARSPETLIVMEGETLIDRSLSRKRGECFFVAAGTSYEIRSQTRKAVLFRAGTPA